MEVISKRAKEVSIIMKTTTDIVIYQAKSGKIEFKGDFKRDTVWASQKQIAEVFDVNIRTINEHLQNIYKTNELSKNSTIRKFRIVQKEGKRHINREVNYYNLDAILSVGYRINSQKATQFRIWATKVLKQHLLEGYTINKSRIVQNHDRFLQALAGVKAVLPKSDKVKSEDIIELIKAFSQTWFSLEAYDTDNFPEKGTKKPVYFTAEELKQALHNFRKNIIEQNLASELFGKEQQKNSVAGIVGNIFQSFNKEDVYPTLEVKAAHLLYFMVKNHPFIDGNKRSGAFAFIWFLRRADILKMSITPEALTTLTLLVAESNPGDKDKIIGLIVMLLKGQ